MFPGIAAVGIGALLGGLGAKQRGGNFLKGALTGAALGGVGLIVYCLLVPGKLYTTLKVNAADGQWSDQELEAHAWLLLKVRSPPTRTQPIPRAEWLM